MLVKRMVQLFQTYMHLKQNLLIKMLQCIEQNIIKVETAQ